MNEHLPYASSVYDKTRISIIYEMNPTEDYLTTLPKFYSGWKMAEYLKAGGNGIALCNEIEAFYGTAITWLR